MNRTCPRCQIIKSIDCFQRCVSKPSGMQSHCKKCRNSTAAAVPKMHCSICDVTMYRNKWKQHMSSKKHYYSEHGKPVLTEKRCPSCQKVKKIDRFSKSASASNGLTSRCKRCLNTAARQRTRAQNYRFQANRLVAVSLMAGIE